MSVASEITRLQNAKASLKTSINAKTDAQHQITSETIDDYSDFVDSISASVDTTDIRNVINMTGASLTSETPFNTYPSALYSGYIDIIHDNNIFFDNAVKGISTGTISEGLGFPIYEDKMTKLSTQDGTPSTSNPIPINTVTGYHNLLNPNITSQTYSGIKITKQTDGTYIVNGTSNKSDFVEFTDKNVYFTIPAGTYTSFTNINQYIYMRNGSGEYQELSNNEVNGVTFTFNEDKTFNRIYMYVGSAGVRFDNVVVKLMVAKGSDTKPYVPYNSGNWVNTTITHNNSNLLNAIPIGSNEIVGVSNNYKDELIVDKSGDCYLNKKTAKINSYNGETIETDYLSTTGGLDTGATVYYGLDTPQLIDLNHTVDLTLYEGNNTVTNSENMDMEITYIKDTYE